MRRAERVILALRAFGEARKTAALTDGADPVAPTGNDFMRIALVAHIPDEAIIRRVEDVMDRSRQLNNAKPCAQMPAGHRHCVNHLSAQLIGELAQLRFLELA